MNTMSNQDNHHCPTCDSTQPVGTQCRCAFADRKNPPSLVTFIQDDAPWRIWCIGPGYAEDPQPWKMVAAFRFLMDALDFIASLQDRGIDCVYQNPTDCRTVKSTDRRMVA